MKEELGFFLLLPQSDSQSCWEVARTLCPESSRLLSLQEKGWEAPVLETFKYVLLMF